jgi:hypothetical protein
VAIPDYQTLMRPILDLHVDGDEHTASEIRDAIADIFDLTEADREEMLPSGRARLLVNRVGWAVTHLAQASALERTREGCTRITDRGRRLLAEHTDRIETSDLKAFPEYIAFLNRGSAGDVEGAGPRDDQGPSVWMVRAGRGGVYAPDFITCSAAILGWGTTGDIGGLSRDEIVEAVAAAFPEYSNNQRGVAVNTLHRVAQTIREGDLIVTPEPTTRTILFGWVSGAYGLLEEPIAGDYQHARAVTWFARVDRDQLSYGARHSLGSMMTLTQPNHASELLRLAEDHASDSAPVPLQQGWWGPSKETAVQRVEIPALASVVPRTAAGDFQTVPRRLMQLLDELDTGHLALPDFQRSFVWAPDATRELIVSMVRAFPAGALLFLQGGSATFKARAAEEAPRLEVQPSYLVLDGQQRLTSLYQAVFGVGASRFFLDVGALISGADINDAVRVFPVERAAALGQLSAQADALMMPLSAIRGSGAGRWRDDVVDARADADPAAVRGLLRDIESAFIDPLVHYSFPVTVLPQTTELEAVCTIFETLNRTGKPLTPFELISARAFAGGHSLYDYWSEATDQYPVLSDFAIEPYYLLQAIALRLGASCKRSAVLALPPDDIAREWTSAVADMAAAISLLRDECGVLIGKWLPYRPMLIPLAAAWREIAAAVGPDQGAMRAKLKRWFWCACFAGEYESSSATLAERDTPVLRTWLAGGPAPPVVADFSWDPARWRTVTIRQQGLYRATIALTLTEHPRDFHTGAPLTQELIEAGKIDDHHIFPRGYLKSIGRGSEVDSVLNHALIDRATNIRIGKRAPSAYLSEIRSAAGSDLGRVLASHRLPTGEQSPLEDDDFDEFLTWRVDHLADALDEECGQLGTPVESQDPREARLNARVERVELRLRRLLDDRLNGDTSHIPQHVTQKVIERSEAARRKQPGDGAIDRSTLTSWLEYFDLREIQDTITSKQLWPEFANTFGAKDMLNTRFGQVAELRNTIRHSRTLTDVTVKDGEAALLWFGAALDGPGAAG